MPGIQDAARVQGTVTEEVERMLSGARGIQDRVERLRDRLWPAPPQPQGVDPGALKTATAPTIPEMISMAQRAQAASMAALDEFEQRL